MFGRRNRSPDLVKKVDELMKDIAEAQQSTTQDQSEKERELTVGLIAGLVGVTVTEVLRQAFTKKNYRKAAKAIAIRAGISLALYALARRTVFKKNK